MFVLNGYFAPPVTNAVYAVTPSTAQTVTEPSSGASLTNSSTSITYTASGIASGTNVTVALFPSSGAAAPTYDSSTGQWTFEPPGAPSFPAAGAAQGEGTTNTDEAMVTSVNGTPITATANEPSVTPVNGAVTFTVNTTSTDGAIPVVFADTSTNGNALDVSATGVPSEDFGVGGVATWLPPAASPGAIPVSTVTTVLPSADEFTAYNGTNTYTYTYKSSDTFQVLTPASTTQTVGSVAYSSGTCVNTTEADFLAALTANDQIDGVYSTTGPSVLCLNPIAPAAPTAVAVSAPSSNQQSTATVTITNPPTTGTGANVVSFNVYQAPATLSSGAETCPTATDAADNASGDIVAGAIPTSSLAADGFTKVGNVAESSTGTTTFTATGLSASTYYCYAVTSMDSFGHESSTATVPAPDTTTVGTIGTTTYNDYTYETAAVPVAAAPISTATAESVPATDTANILTTGVQLEVTFNGPVSLDTSSFSLTLSDGTDVGTVSNSNATASLANSNDSVIYDITGTVFSTPAPVSLKNMEVVSQSGVSNTVGAWNLPGSAVSTTTVTENRVFGGSNAVLTAPPTASDVTVSLPDTVTIAAGGCTDGYQINVYNANGGLISPTGTSAVDCSSTGTASITTTSAIAPGSTLLLTEQGTATTGAGTEYEETAGVTAAPVSMSPNPIAAKGSLDGSAHTVDITLTTQPGAAVSLSIATTATTAGTATVNGTPLGTTAKTFDANSSGELTIVYTNNSSDTSGADTITATNTVSDEGVASTNTSTATDTYTY